MPMFAKIKNIGKTGKGQKEVGIYTWDTFEEYYNECKKQRDIYILNRGEDYILRVKELDFFEDANKHNNMLIDDINSRRNSHGDGNLGAFTESKLEEIIRDEYVSYNNN